jgi:hypothetical protein
MSKKLETGIIGHNQQYHDEHHGLAMSEALHHGLHAPEPAHSKMLEEHRRDHLTPMTHEADNNHAAGKNVDWQIKHSLPHCFDE